jgi:predicted Zn-dependent peptidase
MGLPILGYLHNMKTISRNMIQDYHNTNYVGDNIIVAAAGNIDHDVLHQAC